MGMTKMTMVVFAVSMFVIAAHVSVLQASIFTAPAFLWSPRHNIASKSVNYQIISSKDVAKYMLSEWGLSSLLCNEKKTQQPPDLTLVFIGGELLSLDASSNRKANPELVKLLQETFARSNFSLAFPYVSASEGTIQNFLVTGLAESCTEVYRGTNIAFSDSCDVMVDNFHKLSGLHEIQQHIISRFKEKQNGQADMVVLCYSSSFLSEGFDEPLSESAVLSELIDSMEKLNANYAVLYILDPPRTIHYSSHQGLERFLVEEIAGNSSSNFTACDDVCMFKSSLIEGLLVGFMLVVILLSGLCFMMGIESPSRFESPPNS